MVMPSSSATYGLLSVPIRWFSWYSCEEEHVSVRVTVSIDLLKIS